MSNKFYEMFGGKIYQKFAGNFWFPTLHRKIAEYVEPRTDMHILDVGCGTGDVLSMLARKIPSAKLYGVDLSQKMIEFSKKKNPNASFVVGNAEKLPFGDNEFDLVLNTISFHHYKHAQDAINEAYRVLKPNGKFLLMDIC